MLGQQLSLFQDDVQIVEKGRITMFRCDKDFARWVTPHTPCPMCHPTTETTVCDTCGSEFTDSRYMLEHMRIGGQVRCDLCFPRVTADDCRDPNELHRESEEIRLEQQAQREAAQKLYFMFQVRDE